MYEDILMQKMLMIIFLDLPCVIDTRSNKAFKRVDKKQEELMSIILVPMKQSK